MDESYHVDRLSEGRLALAYPLVRDTIGCNSLESWLAYAETLSVRVPPRSDRGIMTAERHGYIRGLFSYHTEPHLGHGKILILGDFTVLEVAGREGVAKALLKTIDALAKSLGCKAIHALVPTHSHWAVEMFAKAGHRPETICLCRHLADDSD